MYIYLYIYIRSIFLRSVVALMIQREVFDLRSYFLGLLGAFVFAYAQGGGGEGTK